MGLPLMPTVEHAITLVACVLLPRLERLWPTTALTVTIGRQGCVGKPRFHILSGRCARRRIPRFWVGRIDTVHVQRWTYMPQKPVTDPPCLLPGVPDDVHHTAPHAC